MINLNTYYGKLAKKEALTEGEIAALLRAAEHYRKGLAYLASCQAATLESLPKSYSKSGRARHAAICNIAADLLEGNASGIRHETQVAHAIDRCRRAVSES